MRQATLALFLLCSLYAKAAAPPSATEEANNPATPPPTVCAAGGPIGDVDLRVQSPRGQEPLPLRTINRLSEGDTVLYAPLLRGKTKRPGEVALVLVPATRQPGKDSLIVTDPRPAERPNQWKISGSVSVAAFVYGPSGLNKKKVKGFLAQDDLLIAQLADYAEKTAQTEALIQALESNDSSSAGVNAALNGFASQYGMGVQIDKTAPAGAQAMALFQTMNPALATYDPIQPSPMAKYGQTASVATAVATLFFGNPVGLAAGGTAMLLDLRALAFPGTQFRSSFAVPLSNGQGLNMCGPRTPIPPHTKVAYIWATRVPNTKAPDIEIGKQDYIPLGQKTAVPVEGHDPEWKYLERSRSWTLGNAKDGRAAVPVVKLANQKSLEIDLTKFPLPEGDYQLAADWDWEPFQVKGTVHVAKLSDFTSTRLEPSSQDKLVAGTGKVPITLDGDDFEFTTKVELKKTGDEFAIASPVLFKLPKGLREGPQGHMDVQIDSSALDSGDYHLLITQQDDKSHPVEIKILPSLTRIENLPLFVNQGVTSQDFVLRGENLGRITRMETPGATLDLGAPDTNQNQRRVKVRMNSTAAAGATLQMKAYLQDRNEPLTFADAIQVTGPLPAITASTPSPPSGMQVSIRAGEFPAGYTLSASLNVRNVGTSSVLRLGCFGDASPRISLREGEQSETASLQPIGSDQLFVSFDTNGWPAGCSIQATLDNGSGGRSEPFHLGHIVRLPQVEIFKMTDEDAGEGLHAGLLLGRNLEMVEKVGWGQARGYDVGGLPTPIPGQGQKQSLRIKLPAAPSPQLTLCVWLRGENDGRPTMISLASNPDPSAPSTASTAKR